MERVLYLKSSNDDLELKCNNCINCSGKFFEEYACHKHHILSKFAGHLQIPHYSPEGLYCWSKMDIDGHNLENR